eukprot:27353-Eustigmatos_ZCMA.PRE.1
MVAPNHLCTLHLVRAQVDMPVLRNEVQLVAPVRHVLCTIAMPKRVSVLVSYGNRQIEMVKEQFRLLECGAEM